MQREPDFGMAEEAELLHRERVRLEPATVTVQATAIPMLAATMTDVAVRTTNIVQECEEYSMGRDWGAALASIQGRGEGLEVDFQEVPNQNWTGNPHALDYNPAASWIDSSYVERGYLLNIYSKHLVHMISVSWQCIGGAARTDDTLSSNMYFPF
jgi:hypothetical protein